MHHTHRYLLHYFLPAALAVGVALALWQIDVPWYVFWAVLPALLLLALVFIGLAGRVALGLKVFSLAASKLREHPEGVVSASQLAGSETPSLELVPREILLPLAFQVLVEAGITDPDVRFINSTIKKDVQSQQNALAAGANPNITFDEVIHRHADSFAKPPVSEKLGEKLTVALLRILAPSK